MSEHTSHEQGHASGPNHGHDAGPNRGHGAGPNGGHGAGPNGDHGAPTDERLHFWDNPRNVKLLFNLFYACCAVLVVLGFVVHLEHHHSWENLPAFYPIYGFVGIVILVQVAKVMRRLLMRPEDYYEGGD